MFLIQFRIANNPDGPVGRWRHGVIGWQVEKQSWLDLHGNREVVECRSEEVENRAMGGRRSLVVHDCM